jgi:hypothetical protein
MAIGGTGKPASCAVQRSMAAANPRAGNGRALFVLATMMGLRPLLTSGGGTGRAYC